MTIARDSREICFDANRDEGGRLKRKRGEESARKMAFQAAELMPTWKLIPPLSAMSLRNLCAIGAVSRPSFATYEFPGKADTTPWSSHFHPFAASFPRWHAHQWKPEHCSSGLESNREVGVVVRPDTGRGVTRKRRLELSSTRTWRIMQHGDCISRGLYERRVELRLTTDAFTLNGIN